MISGIYKIVNNINNKIYIGSAINLSRRFKEHIRTLKSNKHHNKKMQNSWNKHGENNFSFVIIEYCEKEKLILREQHYIDEINPEYNICRIAGNTLGTKMSDEQKKHLSVINTGKKLTEETNFQKFFTILFEEKIMTKIAIGLYPAGHEAYEFPKIPTLKELDKDIGDDCDCVMSYLKLNVIIHYLSKPKKPYLNK